MTENNVLKFDYITEFNYKNDAKTVDEWGKLHDFPLPPQIFLPDIGFIVDDAAVGFLYTTNSKLGWIEWVFSNPAKPPEVRAEALDKLMRHLVETAENKGCKAVFSASRFTAYEAILQRNGFMGTDTNMNHFIKTLGVSKLWP